MNNYILEYYQKIKDGSIIAGKHIKALYKMIIKGLEKKAFFYSAKKAKAAILFIENFCHHHEERNDLLKLELWQKALVSLIFAIVDENGKRFFKEVTIVIGKKNGKTLLASAIIAYHAYLDSGYGKKVLCCAPKLDQADLVYDTFYLTTQDEPELKKLIKKRKSDLYISSTNTSIKRLAFNSKKSEGYNPSLVVADELSSWPGEQGIKQYETLKSAQIGRAEGLLLGITTAGYMNEGIYDELIRRGTRVLLGESKEKRFLPVFYQIDNLDKWDDLNELQKSNPNLSVSVSVDNILEDIKVAQENLSKRAEFLTKHCNIKQNSSTAWLSAATVNKMTGKALRLEDFRSSYCVAGIDLSQTTDLTACSVVIERHGVLYVFNKFFLPAAKLEEAKIRDGLPYEKYIADGTLELSGENFIDYNDCFNYFCRLVKEFEILPLKVGYDRYSAIYLTQQMKERGFHMDDVFQGFNLTPIIKEAEGLMKDGKIKIGSNQLLKVHLLDTALKMDNENNKVKIIKLNRTCHIDGTAALLDALTVRQKYYDEIGEQLKNEG